MIEISDVYAQLREQGILNYFFYKKMNMNQSFRYLLPFILLPKTFISKANQMFFNLSIQMALNNFNSENNLVFKHVLQFQIKEI